MRRLLDLQGRRNLLAVARNGLAAALIMTLLFVAVANAQQNNAPPTSGRVSVARLNLRAAPSITAPIVTRLPQGAMVRILAISDDGRWYEVETSDASTGWLVGIYVATDAAPATAVAATTSVPATQADAQQKFADGTPAATTTPARMNVRSGPGTNYPVIASAPAGSQYEVIGLNPARDWYQVRVPGQDAPGWLFARLTTLSGDLAKAPLLTEAELPAPPAANPASAASPAPTANPASAAAPSASAAAAAPVAAPNTGTGFAHGITVRMWQGDKQGVAQLVKQLGFGWAKQQIRWEFAEPEPGVIQWQEMDGSVDAMHGNGINLMFSVVTAPAWTRPNLGGTGGPPEDFQLFANFLGTIAGRYCGRLQAIEVWNEQNLRREWGGFPLEPASYMDLLKRSYNAIKGACPSMLVISGATTPAGYSDVAFDDIDYLRGMYQHGLKQYSDGIGIHPSGFANPPSVTFQDWESGNYDGPSHVNHRSFYFLSTVRESRRVMEEFGDTDKRLWPTEFGWGSTPSPFPGYEYEARIDEATQARWIVESFNIMAGTGYVAVPMLWNLNYPRDTEMGAFAVVGRPAFDALRAMMGR